MTTTARDPRTLPPAPPDEWWHRAAERIDSAYAAAHAMAEARKAARAVAPPAPAARVEKGEEAA